MYLSKSLYIAGIQCPKLMWMMAHEKEKIPEPDECQQHIFDQGHYVGNLAKKLFPKGIDIPTQPFKDNLDRTKGLLSKGHTLFEPGLQAGPFYSRMDILHPVKDGWDLVEVKSSNDVKDINLHDVAFQKFVCDKAGIMIKKCFILHLNKEYVRKGKLDLKNLFVKEDVSEKVQALKAFTEDYAPKMLKVLSQKTCPTQIIGPHCQSPYECPIIACHSFLPQHNLLELYRGNKKQIFEMIQDGILTIDRLPKDYELTENQKIQQECIRTNKAHIDSKAIRHFLKGLIEPVHYMDFETFMTAVPMFDDCRPYQQIPFQFSVHVKDKHFSFIHKGSDDPRKEFLKELKNVIGYDGTVVAYNAAFELRMLKELSALHPEFSDWVESVKKRTIDLLIPFRNFYYYHPCQKGSASLKDILPCFTRRSYKNLEICEGQTAYLRYLYAVHGDFEGKKADDKEKQKIFKDLEKYCGLDTEAMKIIVKKLKQF